MCDKDVCCGITVVPPLSTVSLSVVSVIHGQPQSENMKWKIPRISNSCFQLHTILSSVMKSPALSLCPALDLDHPFVRHIPLLSHLVGTQVIRSTVMVLQCLCSRNAYFT